MAMWLCERVVCIGRGWIRLGREEVDGDGGPGREELVVCRISRVTGKVWALEYVSISLFILLSAGDELESVTTIVSKPKEIEDK
jgi:hypothetical protein